MGGTEAWGQDPACGRPLSPRHLPETACWSDRGDQGLGGVVRPTPALGARDPRPSTSESVAPLQPSAAGPSPVRVCGPLSSHLLPALLLPRPCPSLRPPLQPSVAGPSPVSSATFYCTRPVSSPLEPPAPVVYSDSPFLLVVQDAGRPGHRVQLMARARRIGSSLILG